MSTTTICESCNEDERECVCTDCHCAVCVDKLVARASAPNLGALMRQGRKTGLIKPLPAYGG